MSLPVYTYPRHTKVVKPLVTCVEIQLMVAVDWYLKVAAVMYSGLLTRVLERGHVPNQVEGLLFPLVIHPIHETR